MIDSKAIATTAKAQASAHGLNLGKIIELGSHIASGVIALMTGQAVDETFGITIKKQRFNAHLLVQITPLRLQFSLEPAA